MALQSIKGGLSLPWPIGFNSATFALDASGEEAGFVFQVPKTGTIKKIGFLTGAVTTSDSLDIGLYTVDASGNPTATPYGGMVVGTQTPVAANTAYTVTLGTNATVVRGAIVAVRIFFTSFVAGNILIQAGNISNGCPPGFPYFTHKTGGSWSKQTGHTPNVWLEYDDGTYATGSMMMATVSATLSATFNSTSTPDEYALRFSVPFPTKMEGLLFPFNQAEAHPFTLYDAASGPLTAITIPANTMAYPGSARFLYVLFPDSVPISANTVYRLAITPGAGNVQVYTMRVSTAAVMDMLPGGQDFYLSTRTDTGAWTDAPTTRPAIYPIFSSFDDAVSAGALLTHPGMAGGMRG